MQHQSHIVRKRSTFFFMGEAPRNAYLIVSGAVYAYTYNRNGEKRIVYLLGEGDIFPLEWTSKMTDVSLYHYTSLTTCEVRVLGGREVSDSTSLQRDFQSNSRQVAALGLHIAALQQSRAEDALIGVFIMLALRFGEVRHDGWHAIPLRLTHQDLAYLVSCTRETVTANVSALKRRGYFASEQSFSYIVRLDRLIEHQLHYQ